MIAFVSRNTCPVERFSRGFRAGVVVGDVAKLTLSVFVVAVCEGDLGSTEYELWKKFIHREKPFDAVSLDASVIQHQDRRCPVRVVLRSEPFEFFRLLAYVNADRREVLIDVGRNAIVEINLGIQPSTTRSRRGSAEIEKHEPLGGPRVFQCVLETRLPLDGVNGWHLFPPASLAIRPLGGRRLVERFVIDRFAHVRRHVSAGAGRVAPLGPRPFAMVLGYIAELFANRSCIVSHGDLRSGWGAENLPQEPYRVEFRFVLTDGVGSMRR
jgi:hypothetical protein